MTTQSPLLRLYLGRPMSLRGTLSRSLDIPWFGSSRIACGHGIPKTWHGTCAAFYLLWVPCAEKILYEKKLFIILKI